MKKFLKIIGIIFALLIIAAIILNEVARSADGPRQSIQFLNTSTEKRSVTFTEIMPDSTLDSLYTVNVILEAGDWIIREVPPGHYKVDVWDSHDKFIETQNFRLTLKNPEESDYHLYYFDMALDKDFMIVDLNGLYEKSVMSVNYRSGYSVAKVYDGAKPFQVSEEYTDRQWLGLDTKLPNKVSWGAVVYGMFPVLKSANDEQRSQSLGDQIHKRSE